MAKTLAHFSITQEADGYVLHLEDDDGDTTEFAASFDQLDEIGATIEEQLEMEDDEELGLEDDDEGMDDDE